MIRAGDEAPDFTLPDETGTSRQLSTILTDGPVVLFFYPLAMSRGCSAEACHFRDLAAEFARAGAQRIGISRDSVAKQHAFSEKNSFDYPLLSDSDGAVSEAYGVRRPLLSRVLPLKRATFVIDRERHVIKVVASEINFNSHADQALEALSVAP